jgi:hypothetical protein
MLLSETMGVTSKPLRDQYVSKYTPTALTLSTPLARREFFILRFEPGVIILRKGRLVDDQTMFDRFDSLKRELQPMRDSLERIEARLARQGGIIQGGSRQVARLVSWSEDIDQMLAERDRRIDELTRRVDKLENPRS